MFERLQIARVVIIELLRQASVFEVQGFSGHAVVRDAARYTAEGLQCGNLQFLLLGCVLSVLPVQRVQRLRPCKLSFNQRSAQLASQLPQGLGHDRRVGQHRHEVRVALPPGDHVDMQMPQNSGAGDFSQVDADVESIGLHDF